MDTRTAVLKDQGWEQPFDTEPFESSSVWEYRGLRDTGGGMFCRIWTHREKEIELLYGMVLDKVTIIGAKYSEEDGQYIGNMDEIVDSVQLEKDHTEFDKRVEAKQLLDKHK